MHTCNRQMCHVFQLFHVFLVYHSVNASHLRRPTAMMTEMMTGAMARKQTSTATKQKHNNKEAHEKQEATTAKETTKAATEATTRLHRQQCMGSSWSRVGPPCLPGVSWRRLGSSWACLGPPWGIQAPIRGNTFNIGAPLCFYARQTTTREPRQQANRLFRL